MRDEREGNEHFSTEEFGIECDDDGTEPDDDEDAGEDLEGLVRRCWVPFSSRQSCLPQLSRNED